MSIGTARCVFRTVYSTSRMIRILFTSLAALTGLAFGSFLNVCVSRLPAGESVVKPRSHCRACNHPLAWWENIPVLSWIALRGRCRACGERISWRYPAAEVTVAALWAVTVWRILPAALSEGFLPTSTFPAFCYFSGLDIAIGRIIFYWLLVALAILDAENFWLPNFLTYPGIALGILFAGLNFVLADRFAEGPTVSILGLATTSFWGSLVEILIAAGLILLIRWIYWLIRRQEGIGMGDAKLMAMLGAWLGLTGALLAFFIGIMLGAAFALAVLTLPRRNAESWTTTKLPLGTFLSTGGIVSALWGQQILT